MLCLPFDPHFGSGNIEGLAVTRSFLICRLFKLSNGSYSASASAFLILLPSAIYKDTMSDMIKDRYAYAYRLVI